MTIPFTKLHGDKNDFLLTPLHEAPAGDYSALAIAICNRYTGVGADGWMLIDAQNSAASDASIRLFNSDGSEAELSGNGTRCAAAWVAWRREKLTELRIETGAGVKHLRVISRAHPEYLFEMNMGDVRLVEAQARVQQRDAVLVDPGNPQCAFFAEDFDFDWRALGKATEHDPRFPNRTNVSFVRPVDEHTIEVRFWERGAGETMSSGTGSTGAAKAALVRGLVTSPVQVLTPAGSLRIRFEERGAILTGPAAFVAEGQFFAGI